MNSPSESFSFLATQVEFLVSYFPLEATAHRDADLGLNQQVDRAELRDESKVAEMQMQDLEKEYGTQTGGANCFDSCILAWKILRCLERGSLFSRPLNCTPESLGGGEPAIHTPESEGRGSPEQVSSRSCPLWDGVGPGRHSGFRVPLRCGRQHASLLCFVWQRGTWLPSNPAAGKAQTSVLSSMQDGILFIIPNISAKRKMIWCV